ncbi:hypothetical protein CAPTEDRAFT_216572 [Capitella teleta]|uniref:Uncharacterized protein n=1 Tax=Capitella teleta TaxID=283909 RepID=R7TX64_CAPTE|nr:hypothetical protein CAPTEDRAFT_216572 [Capitella teleta]|eukprot:ELT95565.1 hypothetical protein CAPTEDRAFT_216572 [Capitella teleta]
MNRFFRKQGSKTRSQSPSIEFPKLRLPRQKAVDSSISAGSSVESTGSPKGRWRRSKSATPPSPRCKAKTHSLTSTGSSTGSTEVSDVQDVVTLKVPQHPRIRSSSFDASTLHQEELNVNNTLSVPISKSLDAGSSDDNYVSDREVNYSFLDVPKYFRRRSLEIPRLCVHCIHLESLSSHEGSPQSSPGSESCSRPRDDDFWNCSSSSESSGDDEDDDDDDEEEEDAVKQEATSPAPPSPKAQTKSPGLLRRKLVRTKQHFGWDSQEIQGLIQQDIESSTRNNRSPSSTATPSPRCLSGESSVDSCASNVVTLQVPLFKPRSSSVDVACMRDDNAKSSGRRGSVDDQRLAVPQQKRSSSVDVSLPTDDSGAYKAIHSSAEPKSVSPKHPPFRIMGQIYNGFKRIPVDLSQRIERAQKSETREETEREREAWRQTGLLIGVQLVVLWSSVSFYCVVESTTSKPYRKRRTENIVLSAMPESQSRPNTRSDAIPPNARSEQEIREQAKHNRMSPRAEYSNDDRGACAVDSGLLIASFMTYTLPGRARSSRANFAASALSELAIIVLGDVCHPSVVSVTSLARARCAVTAERLKIRRVISSTDLCGALFCRSKLSQPRSFCKCIEWSAYSSEQSAVLVGLHPHEYSCGSTPFSTREVLRVPQVRAVVCSNQTTWLLYLLTSEWLSVMMISAMQLCSRESSVYRFITRFRSKIAD